MRFRFSITGLVAVWVCGPFPFAETRDVAGSLVSAQKTISIAGGLKYRACDKAICYPPTQVPLKWQL
jgi:hypothetical protein